MGVAAVDGLATGRINLKELAPTGSRSNAYGIITSPQHYGIPHGIRAGKPWAGDLGALIGPDFVKKIDLDAVAKWLPKVELYKSKCLFLAGGDIVGDAEDSLESYYEFARYFDGWPLAYVAQNGAEDLSIPESCATVFIGGVPMANGLDWKDSMQAVSVIKRAQPMGKHIHIGRVNWYRRFKIFQILEGSEDFTFDGTRTRYEGAEKTIRAWQQYQWQPPLLQI